MDETGRITPQCATDVVSARLGSGLVVFEPVHRRLHSLNASAAMVWNRLDGTRTVAEVAEALAPKFAGDDGTILSDVAAVVDRFGDLGLLNGDDPTGEARSEPVDDSPEVAAGPRWIDPDAAANTEKLDRMSWPHTHGVFDVGGQLFLVRGQEPEAALAVASLLVEVEQPGDDPVRYLSIRHRLHDGAQQWRVYFDGTALGTFATVDAVARSVAEYLTAAVPAAVSPDRAPSETDESGPNEEPAVPGAALVSQTLLIEGSAVDVGSGCVIVLSDPEQPEGLSAALARRGHVLMYRPITRLSLPDAHVLVPTDPGRGATDRPSRQILAVVVAHALDGAATGLERIGEIDGLRLLLDRAHQLEAHGADGFLALVEVAANSPIYRLTYGSVDAAVEVVAEVSGLRPS